MLGAFRGQISPAEREAEITTNGGLLWEQNVQYIYDFNWADYL
jgi:hypothetical protein